MAISKDDMWRHEYNGHFNLIIVGNSGSSKSFTVKHVLMVTCIPGTYETEISASARADNTDECRDYECIFSDEAPVDILAGHKRSGTPDQAVQQRKCRLVENKLAYRVFEFVEKPNGEKVRRSRLVETSLISVMITCTDQTWIQLGDNPMAQR